MLLAAGWIETLAPLFFVVIWLLRALMAEKQPAQKPVVLEPDDDPAPPRRPPVAAAKGPQNGNDLRTEVEDFLRRVGQLKNEPEPSAPKVSQSVEPPPKRREKPTPGNRPAQASSAPASQPQGVERGASVGEHVKQHVGRLRESQLAEQAARLGAELSQTDERLEQRLHQKFDHQLGALGGGKSGTGTAPAAASPSFTPAQEIAALLGRKQTVRDAVILSEILKRPSEDW